MEALKPLCVIEGGILKIPIVTLSNEYLPQKEIILIGSVHFGSPDFFDKVTNTVKRLCGDGLYSLYLEQPHESVLDGEYTDVSQPRISDALKEIVTRITSYGRHFNVVYNSKMMETLLADIPSAKIADFVTEKGVEASSGEQRVMMTDGVKEWTELTDREVFIKWYMLQQNLPEQIASDVFTGFPLIEERNKIVVRSLLAEENSALLVYGLLHIPGIISLLRQGDWFVSSHQMLDAIPLRTIGEEIENTN